MYVCVCECVSECVSVRVWLLRHVNTIWISFSSDMNRTLTHLIKSNTEPTIAEMVPTPQYFCKVNNFCINQNLYVIIIIIISTLEDNFWNIQALFASVTTIWHSPKKTLRTLLKKKRSWFDICMSKFKSAYCTNSVTRTKRVNINTQYTYKWPPQCLPFRKEWQSSSVVIRHSIYKNIDVFITNHTPYQFRESIIRPHVNSGG